LKHTNIYDHIYEQTTINKLRVEYWRCAFIHAEKFI